MPLRFSASHCGSVHATAVQCMPLRFSACHCGSVVSASVLVAQFSNKPYHAVEVGTLKLKRRLTSGYQSRVRRRGCQKAQLALSLAARYLADEVWAVRVPNRNAVAVIRRAVERRPNAQQARCLNDRRSTHNLSQGAKTIGTPRRALGARTINRHRSIRFGPFGSIRPRCCLLLFAELLLVAAAPCQAVRVDGQLHGTCGPTRGHPHSDRTTTLASWMEPAQGGRWAPRWSAKCQAPGVTRQAQHAMAGR